MDGYRMVVYKDDDGVRASLAATAETIPAIP